MVGEVCRFYGWDVDKALDMPASRFFAMLEASKELKRREMRELALLHRLPSLTHEGYQEVTEYLVGEIKTEAKPKDTSLFGPVEAITASSDQAKYAVMGMFAADRRIH